MQYHTPSKMQVQRPSNHILRPIRRGCDRLRMECIDALSVDLEESKFNAKSRGEDETYLRTTTSMSKEERKIREELEYDVEKTLEQELKDGIYHLALRLHRLYQQRNARNPMSIYGRSYSEVNINIKMEGETKIEINETKKHANDRALARPRPRTSSKSVEYSAFNWMTSLRSGDKNSSVLKAHEKKCDARSSGGKSRLIYSENFHRFTMERKNSLVVPTLEKHKVNKKVDYMLLENGWKN